MYKICLSSLVVFVCTVCQAQQSDKVKMFRNNAVHNSLVVTANDLIYDVKAWSFFAEAPVRSSPLIGGNTIFFGNTRGDFFAINKTTGKLIWQYNTVFSINSSAANQNGKIFFSDNKQTVYALKETTGQLVWKFDLANKQAYPWRFDYYYSSPTPV
jgi:outer membrane protein assembly factor BamB